jgi:hypothetical protein
MDKANIMAPPVLRIRVVYPVSGILILPVDPGFFSIPYPPKKEKNKIVVYTFLKP